MAVLPLLGVAPRTPDARGSRHDEKSSARGRDRRPDPTGHRERELHPGAGIAIRRGASPDRHLRRRLQRGRATGSLHDQRVDRVAAAARCRGRVRTCRAVDNGRCDGPSGAAIANFGGDARPDAVVANFVDQNLRILITGAAGDPGDDRAGVPARRDRRGRLHGKCRDRPRGHRLGWQHASGSCPARATERLLLPGRPSPTGVNPRRIAVADFNADGAADLAITNAGGSSVTVLLRSGAGFAPEGTAIGVGGQPQSIIARDFNGDGRPDLAMAEYATDSFRLLLRQPGGGFVNAPGSPVKVGRRAGGDRERRLQPRRPAGRRHRESAGEHRVGAAADRRGFRG